MDIKFNYPGVLNLVPRPGSTTGWYCTEHQVYVTPVSVAIYPEPPENACPACLEEAADGDRCDAKKRDLSEDFCEEELCFRKAEGQCLSCRSRFCGTCLSADTCLCERCSMGTPITEDDEKEELSEREQAIALFGHFQEGSD